jgi:hypothetical protein
VKGICSLLLVGLLAAPALAQEPPRAALGLGDGVPLAAVPLANAPVSDPVIMDAHPADSDGSGFLSGNHNFRNFIGFMSNPLQSIDPRAVTAAYPIFLSSWFSTEPPVPRGDAQVYGPALTVALSERLAVGLNQGGYAVVHLSRNQRESLFKLDPQGRFRDVELGGTRSGWLNLGGFVQYTLIEDVADQFLLTGGLRWEAPCGSHEVFQGHGPAELAPYVTVGKEFGEFHVLATTGYQFPAGPGSDNTNMFYANLHLDRRCFGWLYPLVEFNWIYHVTSVSFGLPTRRGFIDLDNFEATGNIVSLAAGANAVLIPERLEVGAVYTTSIATQRGFEVNGLLVKMELRY